MSIRPKFLGYAGAIATLLVGLTVPALGQTSNGTMMPGCMNGTTSTATNATAPNTATTPTNPNATPTSTNGATVTTNGTSTSTTVNNGTTTTTTTSPNGSMPPNGMMNCRNMHGNMNSGANNGVEMVNGQPMNALTNNPNGTSWLAKFDRPNVVTKNRMGHMRPHHMRPHHPHPSPGGSQ